MRDQLVTECLFEMKLNDIYKRHSWLGYEITNADFVKLFPVKYKNQKPVKPERPVAFSLTRPVFLEVLVAFRQCFN